MLQFILIVLLAQDINANLGSRNYYKPHSGFYRMQKGYGYKKPFDGYKKPVNTYKKPGTAVTPYCRCIKETTMLNLVVLDQSGTHLGNAVVSVGFIGKTNEAKTDRKGFLKVEVTGCEIGIIVWHNGKQAESRIVNLEKTKTSYKNVVIQIGKACNFLLYFYSSRSNLLGLTDLDKTNRSNLISYLADINGGEQSTSGTAMVGGETSSPLCINVQDGGSLKMVVTSQSAELFSVLCLDEVKEGGQFSMGLPWPVTWLFTNSQPPPGLTIDLVGGFNLNKVEERCRTEYEMKCTTVCEKTLVETCQEEITPGLIKVPEFSVSVEFFIGGKKRFLFSLSRDYDFISAGPGLEKTNYLVSAFIVVPGGISHLVGNAYIIDRRGVTQIIKVPADSTPGEYLWYLGCIIDGNLKHWKEINKFGTRLPDNVDEFEKACEEGILPTSALPFDEDEHNDNFDDSQIDYEFESTY